MAHRRFVLNVAAGYVSTVLMYPHPHTYGAGPHLPAQLEVGTTGEVSKALSFGSVEEAQATVKLLSDRALSRLVYVAIKPVEIAEPFPYTDKRPAPSPNTGACPRCLTCRDSRHRAKACDCGAPLMRDCATCTYNDGGKCWSTNRAKWCAPYSFLPGWEPARA